MRVKHGCQLSLTLFGLCIDKFDKIVTEFAKEEGLDGKKFMQELIFILLYVDDVD